MTSSSIWQTTLTLPTLPLVEGLEEHGTVNSSGFPGLTVNSHPKLVHPGVCGTWPLLTVWYPRFSSGSPPTPTSYNGSLLECAAPGRASQCGTRGLLGLTANPHHTFGPSWSVRHLGRSSQYGTRSFPGLTANPKTHLVPPGVCGHLAAPRSVRTRGFPGLTDNPQPLSIYLNTRE